MLFVPAYAQEALSVRGKDREQYSRIILNWSNPSAYELDESNAGKVFLTFKSDVQIKEEELKQETQSLKNILGVTLSEASAISILFDIPKSSRVRAFNAQGKVFLDVYNPTNPEDRNVAKALPELMPEMPEAEVQEAAGEEVKEEPKEDVASKVEREVPQDADNKEAKAPAVPPEFVLVPENLEKERIPPKEDVSDQIFDAKSEQHNSFLEDAVDQNQHVVSVTSTSTVNMAMFENAGTLWIVMDQDGLHLKPTINSSKRDMFDGFRKIELSNGGLYTMPLPEGLHGKGNGGGILWRLILSDDIKMDDPVEPIKVGAANINDIRKGHIIWPLEGVREIKTLRDYESGKPLFVVLVNDSSQFTGAFRSFVDFDVLTSYAGMAIRPNVDDLKVEQVADGIKIYRDKGLSVMPEGMMSLAVGADERGSLVNLNNVNTNQADRPPSVFQFVSWQKFSIEELNRYKNNVLGALPEKEKPQQVEDLMVLGKTHLAYGRAPEALGFFEFARQVFPELEQSPEFLALRGLARAFNWKSEIALSDLSHPDLKDLDEIKYWKSFVLADLGDWKQAAEILPASYGVLNDYPEHISSRLGLTLAEVNLRDGNVAKAEEILSLLSQNKLSSHMDAAVKYLQGEAYRQSGAIDDTISLWESLKDHPDQLYSTKARLALAVLLSDQGKIDNKQAIDLLEPLRYTWRGDQLEAQVLYWLGKFYFDAQNYVKGLNILRDASSLAVNTALGERIAANMTEEFTGLFLSDTELEDLSALDAIALYDRFSELTPPGEEGNEVVQRLAEKMVKADLLDRASGLLKHQVDFRLEGENKVKVAMRLAAIQLLGKKPDHAMESLLKAEKALKEAPQIKNKEQKEKEITLMKARAYAQNDQGDRALAILEDMEPSIEVSRLIADIAWKKGYWDDAAYALNEVIQADEIIVGDTLTSRQASVIMNRAIALNLADDKVALANMRKKYYDMMLKTNYKSQFDVLTRSGHRSTLADRETLLSIVSEVDLFEEFLDKFKNGDGS